MKETDSASARLALLMFRFLIAITVTWEREPTIVRRTGRCRWASREYPGSWGIGADPPGTPGPWGDGHRARERSKDKDNDGNEGSHRGAEFIDALMGIFVWLKHFSLAHFFKVIELP
jgi:hypothetical protein